MSALESIGSRFKAELSGQLVSTLSGAVLMVFLARTLEPDGYGLLYLALSVFAVVVFVSNLGIATSAARYVAEYRATDPGQIRHVVRKSAAYVLVSSTVTAILLVLFHEYVATILDEPGLTSLLAVGAAFVVATSFVTYVRTLLQGLERIHRCSHVVVALSVAKLGFVVAFVLLGFGALGALVGHVLALALAACLGGVYLYRELGSLEVAEQAEDGLGERILRYSVPIVFTRGSDMLDKQVDTILVGFFLTPVAVGYYVVSKQVVTFVQAPAAALGFTVSPTFGNRKAADELVEAARVYESTLVYVLLLYLPAAAGIAIVAEPAIEYTFGPDYLGAVPVLQILACFVVLQAMMQVTSSALDFLGRARTRAYAKGSTAVANVVLNVLLIPEYGVVGAAAATVATYGVYAAVNLYVISTEFPLRVRHLVRQATTILAITALMALLVASLVGYVAGVGQLVVVVLVGGLAWAVLSYFTGFLEPDDLAAAL